jgi:N-dimethylarginine dimethylaminohydrolase
MPRRYLMCPPDHVAVSYAINPWMDVTGTADPALAGRPCERGHHPIGVELSELLEGGGGTCRTLEVRA